MSQQVANELKEQFRRQWVALRGLMSSLPEGQWRSGELAHLVPARLLYHILSGTEVYARSTSYEEYKASQRFPQDWQFAPVEALPDEHAALGHIGHMESQVEEWLESLGDEGLMGPDPGFPWTGTNKLGRALYLLRHSQNHIGELNSELRRRGLPRGKWE
jgi:hypothetical protein